MKSYRNSQYISLHKGMQIIFYDFPCHCLDTHEVRLSVNIKVKNVAALLLRNSVVNTLTSDSEFNLYYDY